MYEFNGILTEDLKGSFSGVVPSISTIGNALAVLYNAALKLEDIYKSLMTDCESDGDVYIMYSDIEEVLDSIDFEELKAVCKMFAIGVIGSRAEKWIVGPLLTLVGGATMGTNKEIREEGLINNLRDLIDDCEIVEKSRLQLMGLNVKNIIAAIYMELFNTYGLDDWRSGVDCGKSISRGFNEFLIRVNKNPKEIADEIYWKTMDESNTGDRFVFVTNEVDRDPEKGRKIRSMVHATLRDRFEDIIEYITSSQVEDILNGKIKITEAFISRMENDDDMIAMEEED